MDTIRHFAESKVDDDLGLGFEVVDDPNAQKTPKTGISRAKEFVRHVAREKMTQQKEA